MSRLIPLIVVWFIAVAASLCWMARYESTPSATGAAARVWPDNPQIQIDDNGPVLLMFVHPKCPCTRASVGELSQLMTRCQGRVRAYVMLVQPPGVDDEWSNTDLRTAVERIPGVQIVVDRDAALAKTFHAETSGETFLYDTDRQLRFHGGITISRGHRGENAGRSSIVRILSDRSSVIEGKRSVETPVFGCALHDSSPAFERS